MNGYTLVERAKRIVVDATRTPDPANYIKSQLGNWHRTELLQLAAAYLVERINQPTLQAPAQQPIVSTTRKRAHPDRTVTVDRSEESKQIERRYVGSLKAAIEKYTREIRAQWTSELLDAEFVLPDGTPVTWGSATRDQHQQQMVALGRAAVEKIDSYSRHAQAVEEIDRAGAPNLYEAVRVAA